MGKTDSLMVSAKLYDKLNLLSKLSLRKAINNQLLIGSYFYSKFRKKSYHAGLPRSVAFEPTTACNLGCPECPSGLKQFTRPTGNLKESFFKESIESLEKHLIYLTFYFQGEPFINPKFLDMVQIASRKKIYTSTSTNAHFLDYENALKTVESGLDRLIISIDGTDQKTYESYRKNGKLEKVIQGIENITKAKAELKSRKPYVLLQFLVVRPNEHQIPEVKKLAKKYKVDLALKTAQVYDYENGNPLIPVQERYSRYRKNKDGKYEIKNNLESHCWRMWNSCVITWDGRIVPCCFDKDAQHQLGDLKQSSFKSIWKSDTYNHLRNSILKGRSEIDICKNCSEGTKVWEN
ncbi:MAG: SPASM domain-containing protein [Flavobacteriales bacterium]|nr:SPASM domain-containing protein [Flavobacteriales bacterium]